MNYDEIKFGKFYLKAIHVTTVLNHLNLENEEFDTLYKRSFNSVKREGNYNFYKKNVIGDEQSVEYFSSVGYYIFLKTVLELKKYEHLQKYLKSVKNECFEDLIDIYKEVSKTPRKKEGETRTDIGFEDLQYFERNKIDVSKNKVELETIENKEHKLFNKSVVITGEFGGIENRNDLIPMLNDIGAVIKSTVSGKTDFLIIGNEPGPSKLAKAIDLGIPLITEEELYSLLKI